MSSRSSSTVRFSPANSAAIANALAKSDHKSQEVVTLWPGIVTAFKDNKLNQGNRIAEKTFKAFYQR